MPNNERICPYCKTKESEFVTSGLVGCQHCYDAFKTVIYPWLNKHQKSSSHIGKRALAILSAEKFSRYLILTEMLDEAVYAEDYAKIKQIKAEMDEIRNGQ